MDGAEFIVVFNDTKISMKKRELAEKLQFWPKCKGGTLTEAKISKSAIFLAVNTSRILA